MNEIQSYSIKSRGLSGTSKVIRRIPMFYIFDLAQVDTKKFLNEKQHLFILLLIFDNRGALVNSGDGGGGGGGGRDDTEALQQLKWLPPGEPTRKNCPLRFNSPHHRVSL